VIQGDELIGLGACDMKGSLAVMLSLALDETPRSIEVTWIFYAREEISRTESGLIELIELRPDLVRGDVAILAEPTAGVVEAGCQGTLRVRVDMVGRRAHTARPFTGRNAIHRIADVISRVAQYEPRTVVLDGVEYEDQLQVVFVEGGVAANVVPDAATITINHRVAPDRSHDEAVAWLRSYLGDLIENGDEFTVVDWAPSAKPMLSDERLEALVALTSAPRGANGLDGRRDVPRTGHPGDQLWRGGPTSGSSKRREDHSRRVGAL